MSHFAADYLVVAVGQNVVTHASAAATKFAFLIFVFHAHATSILSNLLLQKGEDLERMKSLHMGEDLQRMKPPLKERVWTG